jgi:hypothetical protein
VDVGEWLQALGLERYEAAFRENDVTGDLLHQLTAEDLKELGVATVGHRRRLLAAIAGLQGDVALESRLSGQVDRQLSAVDISRRTPPTHRDVLRLGGFDGAE